MFQNAISRISEYILIKEDERPIVRSLYIHTFLLGLASAFFFVDASRNFIVKISISDMPVGYILSGLAGYFLIQLFKRLQRTRGEGYSYRLIVILFSVLMIGIYVCRILLDHIQTYATIMAYLGFVLMFAFATLFAVGFAGIFLSVFNTSQSKRLFALVGTGEIIASILAYVVAPMLVKYLSTSVHLLLISAIISLLSILPLLKISLKKAADKKLVSPATTFNLRFIVSDKFILYLSLTTVFSIIAVYTIDYSYLISVRYFSVLTGIEVAGIVAVIFSFIKSGEFFFSLFSAGLLSAAGMRKSVLMLPYLLIGGALLGLLSIILFSSSPVFMIFFLIINKWIDRVIRKSMTVPSMKLMFRVTSERERIQLQTNIDGTISQVSTIICGVLLTIQCFFIDSSNYNTFLQATTLCCLALFVAFLVLTRRLLDVYNTRIHDYLHSKHASPTESNDNTNSSLRADMFAAPVLESVRQLTQAHNLNDQLTLARLIAHYNPAGERILDLATIDGRTQEQMINKINRFYFDNPNFFSRAAIISYYLLLPSQERFAFFKESYFVTPTRLRIYFLRRLVQSQVVLEPRDRFFCIELVSKCVSDIFWCELTINDLKDTNELRLLQQLRVLHADFCTLLLLILQLVYDKQAIEVISGILNQQDKTEEDLLFAIELLQNTIDQDIGDLVLPVFEPISFGKRRSLLGRTFIPSEFSVNERLRDILMRDFNVVDVYIKQLALKAVLALSPEDPIVSAFSQSRIELLRVAASAPSKAGSSMQESLWTSLMIDLNTMGLDSEDVCELERWSVGPPNMQARGLLKDPLSRKLEGQFIKLQLGGSESDFLELDLMSVMLLLKVRQSESLVKY